jgi:predicted permease
MDVPVTTPGLNARDRYREILDAVQALPGVRSAAFTNFVPLTDSEGSYSTQFTIDVMDHEPMTGAPTPRADMRLATPDFFQTMGIEILAGRAFTSTDVADAQPVVIINEAMARHYFGDQDAIGRRIAWDDDLLQRFLGVSAEPRTVVGVVADTRDHGIEQSVVHAMFAPAEQLGWPSSLVVRSGGDPEAILPRIREAIVAGDPQQPIDNVATLAQLGDAAVAPRRLNALLLGGFATLAMLIAAVGVGGVLAFSVGSRVREFGVRSALGADRRQVWSGVLAEGATLAGAGLVLGIVAAVPLARLMSGLLYGVPALDPLTWLAVGVLLAAVAMAACWVPAWRAAQVSPMEALSAE